MNKTMTEQEGERIDDEVKNLVGNAWKWGEYATIMKVAIDTGGIVEGYEDELIAKHEERKDATNRIARSITRRLTPPSLQPSPPDDRGMDIIATVISDNLLDGDGEYVDPEGASMKSILATIRREWELQGIALTEVQP